MRAEFVYQPQPALAVAEGKQPFRQELYADRGAVGLRQFLRKQGGYPVAAEQLAHWRARAGLRQQCVLFGGRHVTPCCGCVMVDQWPCATSSNSLSHFS